MPPSLRPGPGIVLRALLEEGCGRLSAERFIEAALYHPECGYYTTAAETVGRRGDFSTAATLDPALGRAVAAWARARRRELLPPKSAWRGSAWRTSAWHLIEIGGGSGKLPASCWSSPAGGGGRSIWKSGRAGWWRPSGP